MIKEQIIGDYERRNVKESYKNHLNQRAINLSVFSSVNLRLKINDCFYLQVDDVD